MDVVPLITDVVLLLLYVTGLVAGILVRRRDGKAGMLITLGFGVQLLGSVLGFAQALLLPTLVHAADLDTVSLVNFGFSVVFRLLNLAAFALVFWGLLRLVRYRPAATAGVAR